MYAVGRLGSYISRGVYTVSAPFHPFGGAVDIIVVEQPDGSFKSSPWYVRFGKFQGVLKAKEKVVTINVNGIDADFHMFLDHTGEAYFLREVEVEEGESESVSFPFSSGDETDEASSVNRSNNRRPMKSKSCNFDAGKSNSMSQVDVSTGKIVARTTSRRSRIFGLVFGQRSAKEDGSQGADGDESVMRVSSLERAELAADLLEVKWSTNLASNRSKNNVSQFSCTNDVSDNKCSEDHMQINDAKNQSHSSVHDKEENSGVPQTLLDETDVCNKQKVSHSDSGLEKLESSVEEASIQVSCVSTEVQVVETSSVGESFVEDKCEVIASISGAPGEGSAGHSDQDGNERGALSGMCLPDLLSQHKIDLADENQFHSSLHDKGESSSVQQTLLDDIDVCNEQKVNRSHSGLENLDYSVEEASIPVSCVSMEEQVVETSSVGEGFVEDKCKDIAGISGGTDECAVEHSDHDGDETVAFSRLSCPDLQSQHKIEAFTKKQVGEEPADSDCNVVLPGSHIPITETVSEGAQLFHYCETSETSVVTLDGSSEQTCETMCLSDMGNGKVHIHTETLVTTTELGPEVMVLKQAEDMELDSEGALAISESYSEMVSGDSVNGSVEEMKSDSIHTTATISDLGDQVEDEKDTKDVLHPSLESVDDLQNSCSAMVGGETVIGSEEEIKSHSIDTTATVNDLDDQVKDEKDTEDLLLPSLEYVDDLQNSCSAIVGGETVIGSEEEIKSHSIDTTATVNDLGDQVKDEKDTKDVLLPSLEYVDDSQNCCSAMVGGETVIGSEEEIKSHSIDTTATVSDLGDQVKDEKDTKDVLLPSLEYVDDSQNCCSAMVSGEIVIGSEEEIKSHSIDTTDTVSDLGDQVKDEKDTKDLLLPSLEYVDDSQNCCSAMVGGETVIGPEEEMKSHSIDTTATVSDLGDQVEDKKDAKDVLLPSLEYVEDSQNCCSAVVAGETVIGSEEEMKSHSTDTPATVGYLGDQVEDGKNTKDALHPSLEPVDDSQNSCSAMVGGETVIGSEEEMKPHSIDTTAIVSDLGDQVEDEKNTLHPSLESADSQNFCSEMVSGETVIGSEEEMKSCNIDATVSDLGDQIEDEKDTKDVLHPSLESVDDSQNFCSEMVSSETVIGSVEELKSHSIDTTATVSDLGDHVEVEKNTNDVLHASLESLDDSKNFCSAMVGGETVIGSEEEMKSHSIDTTATVSDIGDQVEDEKITKDVLHPSLGSVDDSQNFCSDSDRKRSVSPSESSEDEQFLFSDLDESELHDKNSVNKDHHPSTCTENKEVNGLFIANNESYLNSNNFEQENPSSNLENSVEKSRIVSNPISISQNHRAPAEKNGWLVESLPNMWSPVSELDANDCCPLSHSLDSNSETIKWPSIQKDDSSCVRSDADVEQPLEHARSSTEDSEVSGKLKSADSNSAVELSLCKHLLYEGMGVEAASQAFDAEKLDREKFGSLGLNVVKNDRLVVRINDRYFAWDAAAPIVLGMAAFGSEEVFEPKGMIPVDKVEKPTEADPSKANVPRSGSWRLWPFSLRRSRSRKGVPPAPSQPPAQPPSPAPSQAPSQPPAPAPSQAPSQPPAPAPADTRGLDAENAADGTGVSDDDKNMLKPKLVKKKIREMTPTSEQLASLNLKDGMNHITFTFSTNMLGKQQVDARIYLWKWNTRIVISDVDGTITKSDVLGQFMPLVGVDWSQTGVAHLFSAIKENGYELLFLSARAISQAYITRQFLLNLKQDGKALPDGPIVISPDGLFPSLFREVIRRAPHEFKIACLEDIKALFPSDSNPFYAGFGNRDTDEISYFKVGIPKGKIFIINPKGEVAVNRRVDTKSYSSLHALVHDMFPPTTSFEQEDFNSWNFWKLPPPLID